MADVAINALATQNTPFVYTLPLSQEIILKSVEASFNGASATTAFVPCMAITPPGGVQHVYPLGQNVAAGASADISWFPGVGKTTAASSGSGYQFNSGTYAADNVGDWSLIEYTGSVGSAFSQPNATPYDPTIYSAGINAANGVLIIAPSNSGAGEVMTVSNYATASTNQPNGVTIDTSSAGATSANTISLDISTYSTGHAATPIAIGSGTDTGTSYGLNVSALAGTVGGTGTGFALGMNLSALSQAGPVNGLVVKGGDPGGFTTTATVSYIQCQNVASGAATTVYFEVLRPTAGNGHATVFCRSLPTSAVGLAAGALWNNAGVVNVV